MRPTINTNKAAAFMTLSGLFIAATVVAAGDDI